MNPQNSSSGLMRFSKAARMVLQRAHVVAVEQRSSLILPAHLLLALAAEEQGMAGQVLHESQITPETIQHLLSPGKQKSPATINLSPSVQRVLAGAIPIAKEWRSA
jgi:ATP-dependent Clp protease ATP-binding subunit ClpA